MAATSRRVTSLQKVSTVVEMGREMVRGEPKGHLGTHGCARSATKPGVGEADVRVEWQWYKVERSQYHYREPGVVDLGDLDADEE